MYSLIELDEVPVIVVDNFLPTKYLTNLLNDICKLKNYFASSNWSVGHYHRDETQKDINANCTGQDIWLPFQEIEDSKNLLMGESILTLNKYFFHIGVVEFLKNCKNHSLNCYPKFDYNYVYHIINYGNGGYYNWHIDRDVSGMTWLGYEVEKKAVFTFALTIIKDESLLSGGEQLFMRDGKIVKLESKNNRLVIFPSDVYHSLTEIKADENLDWSNRRFNIQAWLCHI